MALRKPAPSGASASADAGPATPAATARGTSLFEVLGMGPRPDQPPTLAVLGHQGNTVALPDQVTMPLRSDRMAAAQAFARGDEFFTRLSDYGFDPAMLFREARLPLLFKPRAALAGAPQGDAVNAEVRPVWLDGTPFQWLFKPAPNPEQADRLRPQLLVKFGSAAPQQRQRLKTLDNGRRRAQCLGLAADPRWVWHELGHVLNYASTGELEFPFAHSAGDALAAIAGDPESALATDTEARFRSFPWEQLTRRHDRSVADGYCWCGARNRLRLLRPAPDAPYRHGYAEEQMLSSTLFRLYRALGGDTRAAAPPAVDGEGATDAGLPVRQAAADYTIYLIVRAIALLGPDAIAPARTVDQFVGALIDADLGTTDWALQPRWPLTGVRAASSRRGGRLHKLIRWAFEQQGLYATATPHATVDGVGQPPPVDVFVPDGRRGTAVGDGGYHPVALWPDWLSRPPAEQAWLAQGLGLSADGRSVHATVGQRGEQHSGPVQAWLWLGRQTRTGIAWQRDPVQQRLAPLPGRTPGGPVVTRQLRFDLPASALARSATARHWALLQLDCAGDPGLQPLPLAPPSAAAELADLVAHDNNLGLARLHTRRAR